MVQGGKSSQEYPVNAEIPQDSTVCSTLFLIYINELLDDATDNIAIHTDSIILYSKSDQTFDLWQQIEWPTAFEPDLRDDVEWGRRWLIGFSA